jgi:hypothetical protein
MREDGVLQIDLFPNTDVYVQHVRQMVEAGSIIANGVPHPVIMFLGEFSTFNKDAREFSADPTKEIMSTAIAYVTTNLANRLIVNFFLTINKPVKPFKMFRTEEAALKWLLNYPAKH